MIISTTNWASKIYTWGHPHHNLMIIITTQMIMMVVPQGSQPHVLYNPNKLKISRSAYFYDNNYLWALSRFF